MHLYSNKNRVTENFWKHGNHVYSQDVLMHLREHFLASKKGRSSLYPSRTVLQHPQFSPSRRKEYFITVSLSWRSLQLKNEEDKSCTMSEHVCSGSWSSSTAGFAAELGAPEFEERSARRCHEREVSARERLQRCRQAGKGTARQRPNTEKPRTALSTQGTGNVIVTGV